jgi:hypothetical protein
MSDIPTRELRVGQWAVLEGQGLVQILAIRDSKRWDWIEIDWTAEGSPIPRKPGQGRRGTWSAYYDDYPTTPVYDPEDSDYG